VGWVRHRFQSKSRGRNAAGERVGGRQTFALRGRVR
jgi:hypothetical protein